VQQATKQSALATVATDPVAGLVTRFTAYVKKVDLSAVIFGLVRRRFARAAVLPRIMLQGKVRLGLVLGCLLWGVISHHVLRDIKSFANVMGRDEVNWTEILKY
jgi:uncharacterized membrane protein YczE